MTTTPTTPADRLKEWATVFLPGSRRMAFSHTVETSNAQEFQDLCALLRKTKDWLKSKSLTCSYGGKQHNVEINRLGFFFRVKYTPPRHIQQRASAVATYHETKAGHATQESAVARLMLRRTWQNLDTCTHDVVLHFRENPGTGGPDEKNSASRAMSNLHRDGIQFDGVQYRTVSNGIRRNPATNAQTEYYFLMPANAVDGGQTSLF